MTLYLAVTPDKYELPICVTDNIGEMARKFKTSNNNISSKISKNHSGKNLGVKFIKIKVDTEEVING